MARVPEVRHHGSNLGVRKSKQTRRGGEISTGVDAISVISEPQPKRKREKKTLDPPSLSVLGKITEGGEGQGGRTVLDAAVDPSTNYTVMISTSCDYSTIICLPKTFINRTQ